MSDLHARLLAELGKPYEIWVPGNVVTPIARQRSALLAVVELHAPVASTSHPSGFRCSTCLRRHGWSPSVTWPCSTIQAIARELGVAP